MSIMTFIVTTDTFYVKTITHNSNCAFRDWAVQWNYVPYPASGFRMRKDFSHAKQRMLEAEGNYVSSGRTAPQRYP